MKKILLIAIAAAALTRCGRDQVNKIRDVRTMTNDEFIKECNKCKTEGYACSTVYDSLTLARIGVECVEAKR